MGENGIPDGAGGGGARGGERGLPRLALCLPGGAAPVDPDDLTFGEEDRAYRLRFRDPSWRTARHEARGQLLRLLALRAAAPGGRARPAPSLLHDRQGRPFLAGVPLSLSFAYAAVGGRLRAFCLAAAAGPGMGNAAVPPPPVGVDAQGLDENPVDARAFHANELSLLDGLADDPAVARFVRALFWTVKEAVLKARGTGLAMDPGLLDVTAGLAVSSRAAGFADARGCLEAGGACYAWRAVPCPECALAVAWGGGLPAAGPGAPALTVLSAERSG